MTHQSKWTRPAALSWKRLTDKDSSEEYWFNYASDLTTTETPAELPSEEATALMYEGAAYWHNTASKEAAWSDPKEETWREVTDPAGRKFWYHPKARPLPFAAVTRAVTPQLLACCCACVGADVVVLADVGVGVGAASGAVVAPRAQRPAPRAHVLLQRQDGRRGVGAARGALVGACDAQSAHRALSGADAAPALPQHAAAMRLSVHAQTSRMSFW